MDHSARSRLATILLVSLTAVWGSTFFLIRDLVVHVPPIDFLAVRFAIAAVIMLALFWRPVRALTSRQVLVGVGLGALYGLAQIAQTVGLATAGLALLSLRGLSVGPGEAVTLVSALLYALHIVGLGRYSASEVAVGLSVVQMVVIAVLCGIGAVPDGIVLPQTAGQWATVLYMVLFASILALWAQTWAQAHLPATRAAIVMTLEPVFAAFFAVVFGGESPTWRMVAGGALVLTAMYAVELVATRRRPRELPAEALHHEV